MIRPLAVAFSFWFISTSLLCAQSGFTVRHAGAAESPTLWGANVGSMNLAVAVGERGRVLTSVDGLTWTPRDSGTTDWLTAVATSGGSEWIAVGDHGTILRSLNRGQTWTRAALGNIGAAQRHHPSKLQRRSALDRRGRERHHRGFGGR